MSIKTQLVLDPSKGQYLGNVNIYDGLENSEFATELLVFLIGSLTKRFKCPIAYFFVNKINGSALSTFVTNAILKLHEIGIRI